MSNFIYCNPSRPCQICGRKKDCRTSRDGGLHFCLRSHHGQLAAAPDLIYVGESKDGTWGLYARDGDDHDHGHRCDHRTDRYIAEINAAFDEHGKPKPGGFSRRKKRRGSQPGQSAQPGRDRIPNPKQGLSAFDLTRVQAELVPINSNGRATLAAHLGLPAWSLDPIEVLYRDNDGSNRCSFAFTMRDAAGALTGYSLRYLSTLSSGKNKLASGHGGLFVPSNWDSPEFAAEPVYCPEGASDVIALAAMGFSAVGRFNNTAGTDHLAKMFAGLPADRPIILLAENDLKDDGTWPALKGARDVARKLSAALRRPIHIALPAANHKDTRSWVLATLPNAKGASREAFIKLGHQFIQTLLFVAVEDEADEFSGGQRLSDPSEMTIGTDGAALQPAWEGNSIFDDLARPMTPEQAAARETELAAERAARAQYNRDLENAMLLERLQSPPCPRCSGFWLDHRTRPYSLAMQARCFCWTCPACSKMKAAQWKTVVKTVLLACLAASTTLHAITCADLKQWKSQVYRRIKRADPDANYFRIEEPGDAYFVVADTAFPGSTPIAAADAITRIHAAIDAYAPVPGVKHSKPFTASDGWEPVGMRRLESSEGQYIRRGKISAQQIDEIAAVTEELEIKTDEISVPADLRPKIVRVVKIYHLPGWNGDQIEWLYHRCLGQQEAEYPDPDDINRWTQWDGDGDRNKPSDGDDSPPDITELVANVAASKYPPGWGELEL